MTRPTKLITNIACGLGLLGVFALLVVLPQHLEKSHYTFPVGSSLPTAFPVEATLKWLQPVGKSGVKTSLNELLKDLPKGALVNFWATWCPPCLEELPSLEYLNRQLKKHPNTFPPLITISVDEKPEDVFTLFKSLDFKVSFTVLYDSEGKLAQSVGTTKFPETYWISPEGKILYKWVGPQDWLSPEVLNPLR